MAALQHILKLPEETPRQIIVVDNSPTLELQEKINSLFPCVEYVDSPINLGFAGGVNLGLARAEQNFVILLNPDARPEPKCLPGLLEALDSHEKAAVAGPKLLPFESGQPHLPSATRRDPDLLTAIIEYTPIRSFFKHDWLRRNYFVDPSDTHQVTTCAMVQGACFAMKRSWIERVGLFDSRNFFLYFEETDFCRWVRLKGEKSFIALIAFAGI